MSTRVESADGEEVPVGGPASSSRSRRRRPLLLVLALMLLAIVAGVAAWLLLGGDEPVTPGPLGTGERSGVGVGQRAGVPFGYGLPVAVNRGSEPAVLDRIELVDPPAGLRVLETRVGGLERKYLWYASSTRWPDPERFSDLQPVRGFRVPPQSAPGGDRGVELVFALQADKPGRYAFDRVAVAYHVGDRRHRAELTNGLRVCVAPPGQAPTRNCPAVRP
jgi:hypothetical protein